MRNAACRIAAMVLFLAGPAFADDAVPKPIISIDSAVFSFGTVPQGTLVKHDFTVRNAGTMDLVIQKAMPSCGCTAALPPSGPIPPGQSAPISVTFDSSGFEGNKEKTIRVFSNDIDNPQPVLTLKGYIETALTIDPVRLSFGDLTFGAYVEPKKLEVRLKKGVEGRIKEISTFSKGLAVETKSNDGTSASALVGLGTQLTPGELRERVLVTVEYKDGREQTFNVPVSGTVQSGIALQPKSLSVGVLEGSDSIVRSARVISTTKDPFSITSVESDAPNVRPTVKMIKEGKIYVLTVTVDPKNVTKDLRASIKISTTSKEQPVLTLNVYGIVPPNS